MMLEESGDHLSVTGTKMLADAATSRSVRGCRLISEALNGRPSTDTCCAHLKLFLSRHPLPMMRRTRSSFSRHPFKLILDAIISLRSSVNDFAIKAA